ncbi:MAG: N-acetylmuramoyl-L-alanine amidase [Burkholderiales bacterium]|nr:N-acetylmuramoyl-L-alanine amidase [Burkholderiales bacterium]
MRSRDRTHPTARLLISVQRRRVAQWMLLPAAYGVVPIARSEAIRVASARLWPAPDYTRVILESSAPLAYQLQSLQAPPRLVLDIEGVDAAGDVSQLPARVQASDAYVAAIRLGRRGAAGLRIVLDLKGEVKPDIFALPPVAEYGHRLVLDLYPPVPLDPMMALLEAEAKKEKRLASSAGDAAPPPAEPGRANARKITVAIDPGHGGEDPGAIGRRGTYEKNVTLAIAQKLKARIDGERPMRAMLTRDGDYFVPLQERVAKARRVQADLFISIHADAFREASARGSSVFALSERGATSAAARWLAQRENQADLIGGVDLDRRDPLLARTLLDLSQTAQISDSLKVGQHVLDGLGTHNALHKPTVEQAGFAVLKAPDIPSILVETAFISNPDEEQKLRSDRHQKKFADSIHDGVIRYFARNPPLARA